MIECYLECKLPSINHLYWHRGPALIMKKEAKDLRKSIVKARKGDLPEEVQLKAEVLVGGDWYFKNGNIRKRDLLNLQKFLIDSVFEGLEADDKQIFDCRWIKIQSKTDFFQVKVEEL